MIDLDALIAEAREFLQSENAQYYDSSLIGALTDALEALLGERDAQAERVSMEVLNEYRRIAVWLESQAALRGATGDDTMHGLAAEALATLIEHEYSRHKIPVHAMLDVWMSLYGSSHPEFDEFYQEHGYAETWARLMSEIRSRAAVPDALEGGSLVMTDNRTNGYELSYRVTTEDAELQAIEVVLTVCNGFDDLDTVNRVLDYVKERMQER